MKLIDKEELQADIDLEAQRRSTHVSRALTMEQPVLIEGVHAISISPIEKASYIYQDSHARSSK